jgi:hypothetical protein
MNVSALSFTNVGAGASAPLSTSSVAFRPALNNPAQPVEPGLEVAIKFDKAAAEYIHVYINQTNGDVVDQWPTQQLLRLREIQHYSAGSIVQRVA